MPLPRVFALLLGLCVSALALSVLLGWLLDIPVLRSALALGSPMRANAALAMLACGIALAVLAFDGHATATRAITVVLGGAVLVLCGLTLSQDLAGWNLGIDQWLVLDNSGNSRVAVPGRMSPPASFSLLLVAAGLLVAASPAPASLRTPIVSALALTVILIGGVALLGHMSERLLEIRFLSYSRIAAYSALGLVLLGGGLFALLHSEGGLPWSLDKPTTAAFTVGIAAMIATAGISYQFTSQMRTDMAQVDRTQVVLKEIQHLGVHLGEFTISAGREATKAAVRASLDNLRRLVELPVQRERLDQIERLHARRIAMSQDIIAAGPAYPALGVEIEELVKAMESVAYAALDRRQKQAEATSRQTFLLLPLGVFVALTMLSLGLFVLNRVTAERLRAQRVLARRGDRLALLHEIDLAIIASKTPVQVGQAVLPRLRDLLGLPRVIVNLFDLEKGEAEWLVGVGRHHSHAGPGVRYSMELMGDIDALRRGEVQLIDVAALRQRAEADALLASGVRWYWIVPMSAGGELIGGLSFGGATRKLDAEQIEIAKEVAAQLAIAIAQLRLAERAKRADARYGLVYENVPVGITMTTVAGKVLSVNPAFARILGYASVDDAIAGLGARASGIYADSGARDEYLRILRRDGVIRKFETQLRRKDGSLLWASMSGRPVQDLWTDDSLLVTMFDDITLRKEQEHRIARLSRMKDMRSRVNAAVARIRDRDTLLAESCRIAVEQGGFKAAWVAWHDADKRMLQPVASAGQLEGFLDTVRLSTNAEAGSASGVAVTALREGASIVTNDIRGSTQIAFREQALTRGFLASMHLPLKSGAATVGVLILLSAEAGVFDDEERRLMDELAGDVSLALDSIEKSQRLDYLAYYDPLTALPNRSLFQDRLSHSLRQRGGDARLVAVVLLDLERFRQVNETLGRQTGDDLLREVADRLRRASDSVARIGTDMFGLKLRGARTAAEVNRALESILLAGFSTPFLIRGEEMRVVCRAGVAIHPDDGADADALMRNAEAALRRSKRSSERIVFYAPDMNARVAESLALENRLRRAVEQRQFVVHYQPKIRLADGGLVGAEALIRWQEPGGGLVPPARFIPLLEETGLIVEVGRWAVEQAFADMRAWAAAGIKVPRVAVNVSAIQLQRKDFVDSMIGEIERGGDNPEWLELEITESLVMHNVEESTRKLSILRGMGVTIAIDDFGTGYSSLSYLSRLPVDALKIDRSFVSGMTGGADAMSIVSTVIALAHGLKLKVVAEGVETEEQARLLRLLQCDEAQGFLFSKPMAADGLAALAKVIPASTPR